MENEAKIERYRTAIDHDKNVLMEALAKGDRQWAHYIVDQIIEAEKKIADLS